MSRVVIVSNCRIITLCCLTKVSLLLESFTADHKPLMGESPEVRGYFLGCGFNSSGMMLSQFNDLFVIAIKHLYSAT